MLTAVLAILAAAPQPAVCAKLTNDYEDASKRLAMGFAEHWGAAREGLIRGEARDTLELIKAHGCEIPTAIPSPSPYILQALKCTTARLKAAPDADSLCETSKWVREERTAAGGE